MKTVNLIIILEINAGIPEQPSIYTNEEAALVGLAQTVTDHYIRFRDPEENESWESYRDAWLQYDNDTEHFGNLVSEYDFNKRYPWTSGNPYDRYEHEIHIYDDEILIN